MGDLRDKGKADGAFNLWVANNIPNTFYFGNIDSVCYKKDTRIFRIIEWKHSGEALTKGQEFYYPLLAKLLEIAVIANMVSPGSGVYKIECDPPNFETGIKCVRFGNDQIRALSIDQLKRLVECLEK